MLAVNKWSFRKSREKGANFLFPNEQLPKLARARTRLSGWWRSRKKKQKKSKFSSRAASRSVRFDLQPSIKIAPRLCMCRRFFRFLFNTTAYFRRYIICTTYYGCVVTYNTMHRENYRFSIKFQEFRAYVRIDSIKKEHICAAPRGIKRENPFLHVRAASPFSRPTKPWP